MKLDHKFCGNITCELYYSYMRERIKTNFNVNVSLNTLLIFDESNDLYWKAEYLDNEDAYAITNNWCKSVECWSIRDDTQYAQRLKIIKINTDNTFMEMD